MEVVDGVVALPVSPRLPALQTELSGLANPRVRLFAKWGLWIRTGKAATLAVPARMAGKAAIGWASNPPARSLSVAPCESGTTGWISFAGGYWVKDPLCLPLVVTAHGSTRTVLIGVGTACPGQRPPPSPSHA